MREAEYLANDSRNPGGMDPPSNANFAGRQASAVIRQRRLADWLGTPAGLRVLGLERPVLQEAVRRFHGDSLLWIGATADLVDTTAQCMVRARVFAAGALQRGMSREVADARRGTPDIDLVVADTAELPFASASIDGAVLHHALEVAADRRGTLREAARVLRPGGRLVVVGFNPWSLWSLTRPLPAFRDLRALGVSRLSEWLAVLGMTRESRTVYLNYRSALPIALDEDRWQAAGAWLNRLQAPLGGAYVLVATKQGYGYLHQRRDRLEADRTQLAPVALPNATRRAHSTP